MTRTTLSTRSIKASEIDREWHLIDVKDQILGRAVGEISTLLQGKSKRTYVPYLDMGDHVVVINAKDVKATGKKGDQKIYDRYSGYQGGRKTLTLNEMMDKKPTEVIREAVSGMLPKNKHRDARLARLHIYEGETHPFAQKLQTKKS
ncbi:50S ribosomal protein L13 [Candidatus Roizmanbacteria bacterium]|nr:MAG: 50S ribosomal protein L13 [Candidatus Roizmanbacteria bacterium]